jgi:hypothetical protein
MIMRLLSSLIFLSLWVILTKSPTAVAAEQESGTPLTISTALELAEANDPWLKGNEFSQNEVEAMAISAGELPDPKMSLGLANIGADNFDFSQEPMTQLKVGVTQMFPRGNTRSLSQQRLNTLAEQYPYQRQNRKAELAVWVSQLWLSTYQAQESIRLINKDRSLFEYLGDVAEASYITASGKTRQQDLIRAQLELTRLDDRLTALHQNKERYINQLKQYISDYLRDDYMNIIADFDNQDIIVSQQLPRIDLLEQDFFEPSETIDKNHLYKIFSDHPAIKALQQRIMAKQVGVELARQKYKPAWGVNAAYGYRADANNGMNRADLFSVGVTFDLPFFTQNRQDQELKAAISSAEAIETELDLLLRKMIASYEAEKTQLNRLQQRQQIYNNQLLPQMSEQAEASLTAYTNDDGDFAEVVRARIAELNAQIDALKINVDIQKTKVKLNYLLMTEPNQVVIINKENGYD